MSNKPNQDSDFKIVAHKKKNSKIKQLPVPRNPAEDSIITCAADKETLQRRIVDAKSEISTSDLHESLLASLQEAFNALDRPQLSKIVCFGLGRFTESLTARYQLALLLCLKDSYQVSACAYDPCFSENEIALLGHFQIKVLETNIEGKYKVESGEYVLFYLPHCPKQLSNNLLWCNWGLSLCQCIIIANSFNQIIERCSMKTLKENAEYISKITPYVLEVAVINSFKFYEVFNDTAVHVFPKLSFVPQDLWLQNKEPKYSEDDVEYVTAEMHKNLSVLRQIISELRYGLPGGVSRQEPTLQYILGQCRKYKVTDEQLCKAREEMEYMARSYLCYLKSSRLEKEIQQEFHGKGERSVQDTARMVGFKLPHDPK